MKFENITPEELDVNKLPHLRFNMEAIATQQKLIHHLNERKRMIKEKITKSIAASGITRGFDGNGQEIISSAPYHVNTISEYDKNEMEIELIKTDAELASTHTKIHQKQIHIGDLRRNFSNTLEEMNKKWDEVIEKAKAKSATRPAIKEELEKLDETLFAENWEHAASFYLNLKQLINSGKPLKKV